MAALNRVFFATRHGTYWKSNKGGIFFAINLISYHKHRKMHTGYTRTYLLTHTYINTYSHHWLCLYSNYPYYTERI